LGGRFFWIETKGNTRLSGNCRNKKAQILVLLFQWDGLKEKKGKGPTNEKNFKKAVLSW